MQCLIPHKVRNTDKFHQKWWNILKPKQCWRYNRQYTLQIGRFKVKKPPFVYMWCKKELNRYKTYRMEVKRKKQLVPCLKMTNGRIYMGENFTRAKAVHNEESDDEVSSWQESIEKSVLPISWKRYYIVSFSSYWPLTF